MLQSLLQGAASILAIGLVFGTVVLIDKLREPHRDAGRPFAVVDERTYRIALRHIDRLEERAAGRDCEEDRARDLVRVEARLISIRVWLKREIKIGSRRKALSRARRLEQVELQLEQLHVRMFRHPSGIEAS
ncbi:hypothetical protein [Micromonospora haikouensis]|uniref:hypothetical protein n=1 Tax=Micromonospora haikouensis TaxID=686309 RepID=UPI003D71D325